MSNRRLNIVQKADLYKHCDLSKKNRQIQEQVLKAAAEKLLTVRRGEASLSFTLFTDFHFRYSGSKYTSLSPRRAAIT